MSNERKSTEQITPTLCKTVLEERSREEGNTEESMMITNSPKFQNNLSNRDNIMVQDQEIDEPSIVHMKEYVGSLLKEQEILKSKLMEQEKRLSSLQKNNPKPENEESPTKVSPSRTKNYSKQEVQESRTNRKFNKNEIHKKDDTNTHRNVYATPRITPGRIKIRSTIRNQSRNNFNLKSNQSKIFTKHRGSVDEQAFTQESCFLDNKERHKINNNHNLISKSLVNKHLVPKNTNSTELLNMKLSSKMSKRLSQNNFDEIFLKEKLRKKQKYNEFSGMTSQYATVDDRQNPHQPTLRENFKRAEFSFEARKKMYSNVQSVQSVESVNLPEINVKRVTENEPKLRKSASCVATPSGKYCKCLVIYHFYRSE
jgi:hypothetical protein